MIFSPSAGCSWYILEPKFRQFYVHSALPNVFIQTKNVQKSTRLGLCPKLPIQIQGKDPQSEKNKEKEEENEKKHQKRNGKLALKAKLEIQTFL